MYIPTQAERYKKCSLLLLMLCVMVPSCFNYASVWQDAIILPFNGGMAVPAGSPLSYLNWCCSFSYPLAYVISLIGIGMMYAIGVSLLLHLILLVWLKFRAPFSAKACISIALSIGMVDLLALKIF